MCEIHVESDHRKGIENTYVEFMDHATDRRAKTAVQDRKVFGEGRNACLAHEHFWPIRGRQMPPQQQHQAASESCQSKSRPFKSAHVVFAQEASGTTDIKVDRQGASREPAATATSGFDEAVKHGTTASGSKPNDLIVMPVITEGSETARPWNLLQSLMLLAPQPHLLLSVLRVVPVPSNSNGQT